MYQKKKNSLKAIALVLVLVLLTIGVAFAIVKVTGVDKTKTIGSTVLDWQVGALDAEGDFDNEVNAIMTKKHLGLDGLKIEVQKKPHVDVCVVIFNKKGEALNLTVEGQTVTYYEVTTSTTDKVEWTYADYIADNSELEDDKPAYAAVILFPTDEDVEMSNANLYQYAKQVTISYDRA